MSKTKYERLVALKDKYDSDNLFSVNQNIKPSRTALTGPAAWVTELANEVGKE